MADTRSTTPNTDDRLMDMGLDALAEASDDTLHPPSGGEMLVNGRYRVEAVLGQGGMGKVLKARETGLPCRIVAIKKIETRFPYPESTLATLRNRFRLEAQAYARIDHPNVVRLHTVEETEGGDHLLIMEYVEGRSLSDLLKQSGQMSESAAIEVVAQILEGVGAIHAGGVIHRDIKPHNIVVRREGGKLMVKVIDLGLGKIARLPLPSGGDSLHLTEHGGFLGSALYSAPEQMIDASSVDHRADLYSIGAVLFELLTGRPPFTGKTHLSVIQKHQREPVPSLCAAGATGASPALDAVIERAMAKDPRGRFHNAQQMREALLAVRLSGRERRLPPAPPIVPPRSAAVDAPNSAAQKIAPAALKRRGALSPLIAVVAVLVLAAAGTITFVVRRGSADPGRAAISRPITASEAAAAPDPIESTGPAEPSPPVSAAVLAAGADGCALGDAGRHEEAVAALELAVAERPKDDDAWFCLAKSSSRLQGGETRAAEAYRAFLKLKPSDKAKATRAKVWLERNAPR